jgi:hypothetical protein
VVLDVPVLEVPVSDVLLVEAVLEELPLEAVVLLVPVVDAVALCSRACRAELLLELADFA